MRFTSNGLIPNRWLDQNDHANRKHCSNKLLDQAASSHEPIQITGKRSNAVLISEEDWRSIQETLHLLSIPGMRGFIREGLKAPDEEDPLVSWELVFTKQAQKDKPA